MPGHHSERKSYLLAAWAFAAGLLLGLVVGAGLVAAIDRWPAGQADLAEVEATYQRALNETLEP